MGVTEIGNDELTESEPANPNENSDDSSDFDIRLAYFPVLSLKCEECDEIFINQVDFRNHMIIAHDNEKPYECPKCDKCYRTRDKFVRHYVVKHGQGKYQCEDCDKSFQWKSDWKRHCKVHIDEWPFKCKQCDQSFKWKGGLKEHIRSVHEKEKKFYC